MEGGAGSYFRRDSDSAVVAFDNGLGNGEAHAQAFACDLAAGGKVRVEDFNQVLFRDSFAVIFH